MNTKKYLKLLSANKASGGFTLIELLVAIAMSGIVITIMGAGMMAILNNSKTSTSKANIKNQLNRAVDYINDDIKKARIAGIATTKQTDDTLILTYYESLNTAPQTIKYYLDVASNPWLGPNELKRQVNGGNWQTVVDGLTENTIVNNTSATGFDCTPGATIKRTALALGGFQACVEQAVASNGSPLFRTTVALFGEIADTDGSRPNSEFLKVGTDTISRSVTPTLNPPILTFTPLTATKPELKWTAIQGAASYSIFKCTTTDAINKCTPTTLLQSVTGTTVTDSTETPGSRSCYRGQSVNGPVTSQYGEIICTIVVPTAVPAKITGLDATDVVQPVVTWARDPQAVQYDLYRCETSNPTSPCTINVGVDPVIYTFTAITPAAFEENVPWSESLNTNIKPADNKAFCYGVVAKNAIGSSTISNVDCGITNAPLVTLSTWKVEFASFDTTAIKPQKVTWTDNAVATAKSHEILRCESAPGVATCDPKAAGSTVVFDGLLSPTNYDETASPSPNTAFCYTIRGKNQTNISAFGAVKCGAKRPPQCVLDMAALGQGSSLSYKSSKTAGERSALESIVKGPFDNPPVTVNVPSGTLGNGVLGQVLHTIEENSSGSYQNAYKATDKLTFDCTTQIKFSWYYPATVLAAPTLTASFEVLPTLSWTDSNSPKADSYKIYRCETTGKASTCTPSGVIANRFNTTPWTQPGDPTSPPPSTPSNKERYCYNIKAFITVGSLESDSSSTVCGKPK